MVWYSHLFKNFPQFVVICTVKGASLVAQLVKNLPATWETGFDPWVEKIPWRGKRLPTPVFWPGEFHGLYSTWGHKQLDTTEQLSLITHIVKGFSIVNEAD